MVAPMSWWFWKVGKLNGNSKPSNIFYLNDVSKEEIERIQALDAIETLGMEMQSRPAYGYFVGDPKHV